MRATQFVRRGLVAFAAVATLTLGLSGVASAQGAGESPGAVVDGDDAIVWVPVPGYAYDIVHANGERDGGAGGWRRRWLHPGRRGVPAGLRWRGDHHPGAVEDIIAERVGS